MVIAKGIPETFSKTRVNVMAAAVVVFAQHLFLGTGNNCFKVSWPYYDSMTLLVQSLFMKTRSSRADSELTKLKGRDIW